jgi:superfamily II DNA helicase RecQ
LPQLHFEWDLTALTYVIHWGPSEDIELYLQETGRADHDREPAHAILYYGVKVVIARNIDENMREYQ